jgi:hypothetical protein
MATTGDFTKPTRITIRIRMIMGDKGTNPPIMCLGLLIGPIYQKPTATFIVGGNLNPVIFSTN